MRALVHASTLFAPLVMAASFSSFAFGVSLRAITDLRAAYVALPLLVLVCSFLGQRRPGFLIAAHGLCLVTLSLAVYGMAVLGASAPEFSFAERPSLAIALAASAWACATLAATSGEATRESVDP